MKLLLDEMLSRRIAEGLRKRGCDAIAVTERGDLISLEDAEILGIARSERRVLVTNNVSDFRSLHEMAVRPGGEGHYGIVYISSSQRRTKQDAGRIIRALEKLAAQNPKPGSLRDIEIWAGSIETGK